MSALVTTAGWAGGSDGAGGDNPSYDHDSAWFVGKRQIQVCLESAKNFGFKPYQLEQKISTAFKTWKDYIEKKQVHVNSQKGHTLATDISVRLQCQGDEDLVFYFGIENAKIQKARQQYTRPYAFAHREFYDKRKGWSRGFVWVAPEASVFPEDGLPNWQAQYTLDGMILHELGHIYGCNHVEGTIMRAEMTTPFTFAKSDNPQYLDRAKAMLLSIDDFKELYVCHACALDYQGRLDHDPKSTDRFGTFERLVGKKPVGEVKARLTRAEGEIVEGQPRNLNLTLSDLVTSKTFSMPYAEAGPTRFPHPAKAFFVNLADGGYTGMRYGSVEYLKLRAHDGTEYLVSLVTNSEFYSSVELHYFVNGVQRPLFYRVP